MFSLYPTSRRSSSSDDDSAANRPPLPAGYIPNHQQNQHRPNPSRVKRALFGPTDHEENRKFVRAELSRHQEEAVKRWNFDFERGCPLEGKLEWQAIPAAERHPVGLFSRVFTSSSGQLEINFLPSRYFKKAWIGRNFIDKIFLPYQNTLLSSKYFN